MRTIEEIEKDLLFFLKIYKTSTKRDIGIALNISPKALEKVINKMIIEGKIIYKK